MSKTELISVQLDLPEDPDNACQTETIELDESGSRPVKQARKDDKEESRFSKL